MVVTKIQAAPQVKTLTRVAAYIRVSSDSEDQLHSFSAQYRYYRELFEHSTDEVLSEIYADEGITGTCTEKRAEFNRMMNDARRHRFDRIIVKSLTRFARNTKDCLEATRELKQLGISVYFEENGIDTNHVSGEMLITLLGMAAQNESVSISNNLRWGIRKRMEDGTYINCSAAFGYDYIDGKLVVNERDAEIVRRIFTDFLAGKGTQTIAEELTAETGEIWHHQSISYILSNERYIGDKLLHKYCTTEMLPFKKHINKGEQPKYYVRGTHEPIIDEETFRKAQQLITSRRSVERQFHNYVFSKMIVCGYCEHSFRRSMSSGKAYWICGNHNKSAANCPVRQIPETGICSAFVRLFNKLKAYSGTLLKPAAKQLEMLIMKKQHGNSELITARRDMVDAHDQLVQVHRLRESGLLPDEIFNERKKEIEFRLLRLKEKAVSVADTDEPSDRLTRLYDLIDLLEDTSYLMDFDESIFRLAVEKIVALSENEILFNVRGGLKFKERIER
ncbi:MAG: recombinase family protein [Ruminiclostridium sp.]|nr:recombinase family protein [Ruminiclostridium sp.]